MPLSLANDQLRLARLHAQKTARGIAESLVRPFSARPRGRHGRGETLRLVLRDMRPPDLTFFDQARRGVIQLGGESCNLGSGCVFSTAKRSEQFRRAAHSFGWLNDLRAAEVPEAAEMMRTWTVSWLNRSWHSDDIAGCPAITTRRVLSWLAHADILLDDVEDDVYDGFMERLVTDLSDLSSRWHGLPRCQDRATAGLALMAGAVAVPCCRGMIGDLAPAAEAAFCDIVEPDGSPVSRNASDLIEILFVALPVVSACVTRDGKLLLPVVAERCNRARAHLQVMRLGDGALARFHGVDGTARAELARIGLRSALQCFSHAGGEVQVQASGGYVRIHCGETVIIADVGAAPPVRLSGHAHAGCLSFELSSGNQPVFVNQGVPAAPFRTAETIARARATASHTTLTLGSQSSSRRLQEAALKHFGGGEPIVGPEQVSFQTFENDAALGFVGSHDGYLSRFGVHHSRELHISRGGSELRGTDRIGALGHPIRFLKDLPFAVHFHLHPRVRCSGRDGSAEIALPNGERWQFVCEGARLSIEESVMFADASGPKPSTQIVLRGVSHGETVLFWRAYKLLN